MYKSHSSDGLVSWHVSAVVNLFALESAPWSMNSDLHDRKAPHWQARDTPWLKASFSHKKWVVFESKCRYCKSLSWGSILWTGKDTTTPVADSELVYMELAVSGDGGFLYCVWSVTVKVKWKKLTDIELSLRLNSFLYRASSAYRWPDGEETTCSVC